MILATGSIAGAAPESRADISNQAHGAVEQLRKSWSGYQVTLDDLDKRALEMRQELRQRMTSIGLKRVESCTILRMPPNEGTILTRYEATELDFSTRQQSEFERLDQLKTQSHDVDLGNAAEDVRTKLFRQLAWSEARLRMTTELHTVFRKDYALRRTVADNDCTIRQILGVRVGLSDDLRNELLHTLSDIDTATQSLAASPDERYHDALDRIAAMP